jgi:adenine-specific DNA-methyltransferase
MKYMGSKRWMLRNGLGHLIQDEIKTAKRFVDLFSGSGAVAQFAAMADHPIEVRAYDLQLFCAVLAGAVISRDFKLDAAKLWTAWLRRATEYLCAHRRQVASLTRLPRAVVFTQAFVEELRLKCATEQRFSITSAYGGHYFSYSQALWLDALRATLPEDRDARLVSLAALVQAASQCAASPGHTAQPFQPTRKAKKFLYEAWQRSITQKTEQVFRRLCAIHANLPGSAEVDDANVATAALRQGDLVFMDPPYSGVHYSRFYHVLETIANGQRETVSGIGRYPPTERRPWSKYSVKSESAKALDDLLRCVAGKGARALLTFPDHDCSNGLSGDIVATTAAQYFKVQCNVVENRFSTMGGTKTLRGDGYGRAARQTANELIFILKPT